MGDMIGPVGFQGVAPTPGVTGGVNGCHQLGVNQ